MSKLPIAGVHEQDEDSNLSQRPRKIGRDFGIEEPGSLAASEVRLLGCIGQLELWQRIPLNGPKRPRRSSVRAQITNTVMAVWIAWITLGFIWLFTTGSFIVLGSSAILVVYPLKKVLDYYLSRNNQRRKKGTRHPERHKR